MTNQSKERRRYHRLQPSVEPEPQATFYKNGEEIHSKVVNLSPGGLLCYLRQTDYPLAVDDFIPKIVVKIPEKTPVTYSGRVVRIQQKDSSQEQQFCAIEFVKFKKKVLQKGEKALEEFEPDQQDHEYLNKLQTQDNFLKANSLQEELEIRKRIYDSFAPESKKLPLEERWFFYEVIDELKYHEPNYPNGLQKEFIRLCRGEDRSEFVLTHKPHNRFKRLLKKILPLALLINFS